MIAVACQSIENAAKIDLAVTNAPKSSRPVEPILIAAVGPTLDTWSKLGMLDVKGTNPLMVAIDETDVIHLLEQKVTESVVDLYVRVMVDTRKETLECGAIVQILPGVKFEA